MMVDAQMKDGSFRAGHGICLIMKLMGIAIIRGMIVAIAATVGLLASEVNGRGAEKFQKLTGPQIRVKFAGMEMTDNVHWADVFGPNGELRTYSMGTKKGGKWRVEKDELCVDRGKDDGGCYQVWLSGTNVEFRHENMPAVFEGVLQRSAARN